MKNKENKMTNEAVLNLGQALNTVGGLSGCRFAYAIAKNKKLIEVEIESLNTALKASEKYQEFDGKRIELCKRLADKDEKGEPKMANNSYTITVNKAEFDKKLESLRTEFKDEVEAREKQIKEFNELLKKESSYVPYKIKLADLPKEITVKQTEEIYNLIEE